MKKWIRNSLIATIPFILYGVLNLGTNVMNKYSWKNSSKIDTGAGMQYVIDREEKIHRLKYKDISVYLTDSVPNAKFMQDGEKYVILMNKSEANSGGLIHEYFHIAKGHESKSKGLRYHLINEPSAAWYTFKRIRGYKK
ncbi:hypothetical protein HOD29_05975 [archaeon]|jgi:hypothetical protein|nr:hypothetical protein [archaeon]